MHAMPGFVQPIQNASNELFPTQNQLHGKPILAIHNLQSSKHTFHNIFQHA